jgi:hypothetical protein
MTEADKREHSNGTDSHSTSVFGDSAAMPPQASFPEDEGASRILIYSHSFPPWVDGTPPFSLDFSNG